MTTSEPTTGEIVFALICFGNCENCSVECYYLKRDCGDVLFDASARLKSQEQRIAELTEKLEGKESTLASLYPVMLSKGGTIAALTARAEQAEHRASDFEYAIRHGGISCATCGHNTSDDPESVIYAPCDHEHPCVGYDEQHKKWTLRDNLSGLPQEGEQNNGQANNDHLR